MKIIALGALILFFCSISNADDHSQFCKRTKKSDLDLAQEYDSRINFPNDGGLFNKGVCWWHSRLQRSSLYLAYYTPNKPRVTDPIEVGAIIDHLINMDQVVEITGYANFNEFTEDYPGIVQEKLNRWQLVDGILYARWLDGMNSMIIPDPVGLRNKMDRLYQKVVVQHQIIFLKSAEKGIIGTHAYLVIGVERESDGYTLSVINSNYPGATLDIAYHFGDPLLYNSSRPFMVFEDYDSDLDLISKSIENFCLR